MDDLKLDEIKNNLDEMLFELKEEYIKKTPKEIYDELSEYIIGQDDAKKKLSVALYQHNLRVNNEDLKDAKKSNILMIGPTGVGKTLFAKVMAKIANLPLVICDATTYTQTGYTGEDVENILVRLIHNADFDIERAQKGIVFIDEFDKIARKNDDISFTRDVSGEGVQNALLKIIEGSVVKLPQHGGRKHLYQDFIKFDTSNVLFICAGSFEGKKNQSVNNLHNYNEIDAIEQIEKFGIIPELLGRLPVFVTLNELTVEDLRKILTETKDSLINQYKRLFNLAGINLEFTDEALDEIATSAHYHKFGARSLCRIIEDLMTDVIFNIDQIEEKNLIIDLDYIKKHNMNNNDYSF